jgi:type I restriction enzyme S subunit
MSELPRGWISATIDDVADYVQRGKSPAYTEHSKLPVINQKCIRWHGIEEAHLKYVDPTQWDAWGEERFLRAGDILWNSTGTGTIGRASLYTGLKTAPEAVVDSHVTIVRPNRAVLSQYLHRLIQSPLVQSKIDDMQSGSTNQVELARSEVLSTQVPLPPLPEQRRIVAKIDSLSAKSKRARDHLDHVPRLVEKYKQAILAAAFRGGLSEKRRCQTGLANRWSARTIGSLLNGITAGKNLRCEERPPLEHEKGVLKVSAVTWGKFDPSAAKTLPSDFSPPENTRVRCGDFLFSRANTLELVGAVVIVHQSPGNLYLSDKVLRFGLEDECKPWLLWFLRSPLGRQRLEATATGNQLSMRNISQAGVSAIELPWPSSDERHEIVGRIETAFAWIDRLATEASSARKLIDQFDQGILAKAFRGELVPQDPNDEPASVLLERISAERQTASTMPSRKRQLKVRRGRKK